MIKSLSLSWLDFFSWFHSGTSFFPFPHWSLHWKFKFIRHKNIVLFFLHFRICRAYKQHADVGNGACFVQRRRKRAGYWTGLWAPTWYHLLVVIFKWQRAESPLPLLNLRLLMYSSFDLTKIKKSSFVYQLSLAVTCEVQFIDCLKLLFSFLAQLAELFISWSKYCLSVCLPLCACVSVCLDVNQGGANRITAAHRDL